MNTPAHIILNMTVLGKRENLIGLWIIGIGAFIPDLFLFLLAFVGRETDEGIRSVLLYCSDIVNSIPIVLSLLLVAWCFNFHKIFLLGASAMLHILCDLPLHSEDAHRHFFPFSNWVFQSPVSFWDADHFGIIFGTVEAIVFVICIGVLWNRFSTQKGKAVLLTFCGVYVLTFIHFLGHAFAHSHWAIW